MMLIYLFYLIFIGFVRYDTNDDLFLYLFTSGTLGEYCSYSVHQNLLMSSFLAAISKMADGTLINWNTVYYLAEIIVTYISLSVWLLKKRGLHGAVQGLVIMLASVQTIMNSHNYSKTGALVMIVGVVILATNDEEDTIVWRIIAAILLITGGLYRFDTTKAVIPFVVVGFVYGLLNSKKHERMKRYFLWWFGVFSILSVLWAVNYWFYNVNDKMVEYTQFNQYRTKIIDYGIPNWESNCDEYETIGWSQNDVEFFGEWNYADNTTYTVDTLKTVSLLEKDSRPFLSVRKLGRVGLDLIKSVLPTIKMCVGELLFWIIVLNAVMAWVANKKNGIWALIVAVGVGCELLFLNYLGRTPERAIIVPLICGVVSTCMFETPKVSWKIDIAVFLSVFILGGVYKFPDFAKRNMASRTLMNETLSEISSKRDSLYVWDVFAFAETAEKAYSPLDGINSGYLSNSTFLGGWVIPTPIFMDKVDKFGERGNTVETMLNNDNVYYITFREGPSEVFLKYLLEHYGYAKEPRVVEEKDCLRIYSFAE